MLAFLELRCYPRGVHLKSNEKLLLFSFCVFFVSSFLNVIYKVVFGCITSKVLIIYYAINVCHRAPGFASETFLRACELHAF